ncbi:MAG TPA: S-adenosylmethionine decarboxylase [Chitinophagaceae bacterium]|nr:S-adenosylmethionine decarboxylase [Chitinophagaceae bacterium]
MSYHPGTHLIATLKTENQQSLGQYLEFSHLLDKLIQQYDLQKIGEVYHDFSPGGFTAIVCLSESHLSIHTWPEYGKINMDIYLSNYLRENDGTVHSIYDKIKLHFGATVENEQFLKR